MLLALACGRKNIAPSILKYLEHTAVPSVVNVITTRYPQVIANDKGEVVVRPRGMWEGKPVHNILAGPNSSMPPNCAQPDLLIGTYKFDCFRGKMESEDTDRNFFVLDLTKTAFLREGFSISRAGGSTAKGANSPSAPNEKGEGNRPPSSRGSSRASSRPSSGKVEVTGTSKGTFHRFGTLMGSVDSRWTLSSTQQDFCSGSKLLVVFT